MPITNASRGSLYEAKHWLRRAYKRQLLSTANVESLRCAIDELLPKLNAYINSIGPLTAQDDD